MGREVGDGFFATACKVEMGRHCLVVSVIVGGSTGIDLDVCIFLCWSCMLVSSEIDSSVRRSLMTVLFVRDYIPCRGCCFQRWGCGVNRLVERVVVSLLFAVSALRVNTQWCRRLHFPRACRLCPRGEDRNDIFRF
jgi:hypothetical protein